MKFKAFLLFFLICVFMSVQQVQASKLPDDMWAYIKKSFPNASQRFDSVVLVSKNVMYVPLYPAQKQIVDEIKIDYVYPKDKPLAALPEVVILNNNFVLLKLMKDKTGVYTITQNEDLPLKVKLGVMPQDMLVPPNLKIPESMRLILGDLVIPSMDKNSLVITKDGQEQKSLEGQVFSDNFSLHKDTFFPLSELKGKKAYVSSNGSKFLNVFDETSANALYELKLNALPSKIIASNTSKYALVSYFKTNNLEVLDLRTEKILRQLDIESAPKDISFDTKTNIAYLSAPEAKTIYTVNMISADIAKAIKLTQSPNKLAINTNGNSIAFTDWFSQELFVLELSDNFSTRLIGKVNNVSSLIFDNETIYTISRTRNKMIVYDAINGTIKDETKLHAKPTDAILFGDKIFILCAENGLIDVYGTKEKKLLSTIELDKKGFYSKITQIPNDTKVIITGFGTEKFVIVDLESQKVIKDQAFEIQVSNFVIVDK